MGKTKMTVSDLKALFPVAAKDYAFNGDIFCEDSPEVARLKWILANRLSRGDRTVLLLYAEADNYRLVARSLRVSESYARKRVGQIREKIKAELARMN